jgi:hypothetical protein
MTYPLFRAIKFGAIPVIGAVLDAGADINAKVERRRNTLLMTFCSPMEIAFERGDKAVLEFLLSHGRRGYIMRYERLRLRMGLKMFPYGWLRVSTGRSEQVRGR